MKRWGFVGLILVLLGSGIWWRLERVKADRLEQEAGAARRKGAAPKVGVAVAVRRDVVERTVAVGIVEPADRIEIEPKVAGRVQGLVFREGEPVAKGTVVASIRNAELDAQIVAQEARVAEAVARLAEARLGLDPNAAEVAAAKQR
ncbi:MAG: biotin/lipoyl-binding protein, partial [Armatimonadota bacterium]